MDDTLRHRAKKLFAIFEKEHLEKVKIKDNYLAEIVDQDLYKKFETEALGLLIREEQRLLINFNFEKDYSEEELSDLLVSAEKDVDKLGIWLDELKWRLRAIWNAGSPPNQESLNIAYFMLASVICERKGGPLEINEQRIKKLTIDITNIDKICTSYCRQRFMFYKPQFGEKVVPKNTINLRVDDTFLKFRAFFAASLSSYIHILRNVCDSNGGFLSRMILARALLEVAIHNLFVVRKLLKIAKQVETEDEKKSIENLERFRNVFYRGMFGTKSPLEKKSDFKPFNILTCLQFLEKEPIGNLPYSELIENYEHLCDFTHPNLLMRSCLSEVAPARGDVFCDEVLVDIAHLGTKKSSENLKYLVKSLECCVAIMKTAFNEKEQIRVLLNQKNLSNKDEGAFNKATAKR